jgi:phosphatidylglycerophosphate synthase
VTAAVREAIVLVDPGDGARQVAGVPLLLRTILVLQRAGIERCTVVGGGALPVDPRICCRLVAAPTLEVTDDEALRVVVGAGAVIDETLVRDLVARARPGGVLEVEHAGVRVRVAPGPLVAPNGAARAPVAVGTLLRADAPDGACERALLRGLQNPRDGYFDRILNRRLSRRLTTLLLPTALSANAITVFGVVVGVVGGALLALHGPLATIAAVLCLVLSGVLDCVDGEVARLRFAESRLGHLLDIAGDTVVHAALLCGIVLHLALGGHRPGATTLVALALGVVGAFAAITWSDQTQARRGRPLAWENRVLDGVLSPLTTRDWYVFPLAFALLGRLEWLVPAAAVGAHLFWVAVVVLVLRALATTRARQVGV